MVTIMLIGALLSLTYARIRWRVFLPIWLPIIFLTALHLSFHATARYRLPLDPLLIALASGVLARGRSLAGIKWAAALAPSLRML